MGQIFDLAQLCPSWYYKGLCLYYLCFPHILLTSVQWTKRTVEVCLQCNVRPCLLLNSFNIVHSQHLDMMVVMFVNNKEESNNNQLFIEKKLIQSKLGTLYLDIFICFDMLE